MMQADGGSAAGADVVAAIDAGSVARNLAWASRSLAGWSQGRSLAALAKLLEQHLRDRERVALGIDSPLWIPLPEEEQALGMSRPGEGNRPWSAHAGATIGLLGLAELAWVLRHVGRHAPVHATTDLAAFQEGKARLLVWEAFVTGPAKGRSHAEDARLAVQAFLDGSWFDEAPEGRHLSLAGLAILVSGLPCDDDEVLTRTFRFAGPRHTGAR